MPADYTPKLEAVKAKLQAKGMSMQFVRRDEDLSVMPTPGGGRPIIETRTEFFGVKLSPTLTEIQGGVFRGEDLVVLMPGDVCEGRPDTTDELIFQGKRWKITDRIRVIGPTDLDIAYKVAVMEAGAVEETS